MGAPTNFDDDLNITLIERLHKISEKFDPKHFIYKETFLCLQYRILVKFQGCMKIEHVIKC